MSRADVRKHFAALLAEALAGAGKPAQAVYDHHVGDFRGQTPVVVVGSAGTERAQFSRRTLHGTHALDVFAFVLYALQDGTWTEADADQRLDEIDAQIAAVVAQHQVSAHWGSIGYDGRSETGYVPVGGLLYRREGALLVFGPA